VDVRATNEIQDHRSADTLLKLLDGEQETVSRSPLYYSKGDEKVVP